MGFANPIWLWGLAGLIIPVTIHLLSRKESKTIKVGSLRHLNASTTNQAMSFRLNEIWLLVLRCLIILLTVAILSGFYLYTGGTSSKNWLLVEKGVNQNNFKYVIDSLTEKGFSIRQFAKDFPPIEDPKTDTAIRYWQLVSSLENKGLDNIVILSRNRLQSFKGKRVAKPDNLTWLTADLDSGYFNLMIFPQEDDSVFIRKVTVTDYTTSFQSEKEKDQSLRDSVAEGVSKPITVLIVSDVDHAYEGTVMEATIKAIEKNSIFQIDHKSINTDAFDVTESPTWIIWLADEAMPDKLTSNIIELRARSQNNAPLIEQRTDCMTSGQCWVLTQRPSVESVLDNQLTMRLSDILLEKPKSIIENIVTSNDRRILSEEMLWSHELKQNGAGIVADPKHSDAGAALAIILMLLLATERFIAFKRNQ